MIEIFIENKKEAVAAVVADSNGSDAAVELNGEKKDEVRYFHIFGGIHFLFNYFQTTVESKSEDKPEATSEAPADEVPKVETKEEAPAAEVAVAAAEPEVGLDPFNNRNVFVMRYADFN